MRCKCYIRSMVLVCSAFVALGGARLLANDCEATELFPLSGEPTSVAIDGDVIVTGAGFANGISNFTGAAFVYRYQTGVWQYEAKLQAFDGIFDDRYGWSIAVSGNVVVVGSRDDEHEGFDVGSAYVYRFVDSQWIFEAKLIPPDGEFLDRYGKSVAIENDVLVVGSYLDDDGDNRSGSAYVYRFDGSNWQMDTKLVASDPAEGAEFGHSVAIEDNVIVVGARDFFNGSAGAAYVFRFDGVQWLQEAKLEASDGQDLDFFGDDVDISGNSIIVGAMGNDEAADRAGAAYIYSFNGKAWGGEQKVFAANASYNELFGRSVAIDGDLAICGSSADSPTGSVTVFQSVNGDWIWIERIEASDGSPGDQFSGHGIAIQDNIAVVNASNHHHGDEVGSSYVFSGLKFIDCNNNFVSDPCEIADGASQDCNSNFVPDECDIAEGISNDNNANGIPDECECLWDINGDGEVGVLDLLEVVHNLGQCIDPDNCPWDIDANGVVNGRDVKEVATHFGDCE